VGDLADYLAELLVDYEAVRDFLRSGPRWRRLTSSRKDLPYVYGPATANIIKMLARPGQWFHDHASSCWEAAILIQGPADRCLYEWRLSSKPGPRPSDQGKGFLYGYLEVLR